MKITVDVEGMEITVGGVRYWAVPLEAPQEPAKAKPVPAVKKQAPKLVTPKASAAPTSPAPTDARMPVDGPAAKILALLARKPMSSIELIEATKLEAAQVYNAAHNLKKAGRIENIVDPDDETRRYALIKKAA